MQLSRFDRIIASVSPKYALSRVQAKAALGLFSRSYDGASRGRRFANWFTSATSANSEINNSTGLLRDRARDLVRNNPFASKGLQVIVSNTVGEGIIPEARHKDKATAKLANDNWIKWAETQKCDARGLLDFYGIQALVLRTVTESGECFVKREYVSVGPNEIPIKLTVLEPDYLDEYKNETLANGGRIFNGIEFDSFGKPIAYHFRKTHPGDINNFGNLEVVRVEAKDIIHCFRVDRPGQSRGVTWYSPVITRLRDFDEYEDAQLVKQKISACFAGFITSHDDSQIEDSESEISDRVEPGVMQKLAPGESVTFSSPPQTTGYSEFARVTLQGIAAGLGVSYEAMTGDLSNVNFSSGRMGWLEFHRNIKQWRHHMIIPMLCDGVFNWFKEASVISFGARMNDLEVTWTPPKREMIDPAKEYDAVNSAVRSGQMTLSEAIRERGFDPGRLFKERSDELKMLDQLGIKTDSDPRGKI